MKRQIEHSKPTLTVFADASVFHDKKVAGWGGWARGDDRPVVTMGGPLPFTGSVEVAELWALARMLGAIKASGYMTDADVSIILQSDCLHGLNKINGLIRKTYASNKGGAPIRAVNKAGAQIKAPILVIEGALTHAKVIYLRHVRGHQGGDTARSWVNEECDRLAKAGAFGQEKAA